MQSNNGCTARHATTTVTAATTDSDRDDDDEIDVEEAAAMRVKNRARRGRTTVLEGADGLTVELGRQQRSRRSSCVSFSIVGRRDSREDEEDEDEDEEVSDEEVVLVGRTNNEDHED